MTLSPLASRTVALTPFPSWVKPRNSRPRWIAIPRPARCSPRSRSVSYCGNARFSTTMTSTPRLANSIAVISPTGPAPTTRTSVSMSPAFSLLAVRGANAFGGIMPLRATAGWIDPTVSGGRWAGPGPVPSPTIAGQHSADPRHRELAGRVRDRRLGVHQTDFARTGNVRGRQDAVNGRRHPGQRDLDARRQMGQEPVSYTHLRAHETDSYLVCR